MKRFRVWEEDLYQHIMVPVDLEHIDSLQKALKTAALLSNNFDSDVCYVGVTTETPSSIAHNPDEYESKLAAFARKQADEHGIRVTHKTFANPDPSTELNKVLLDAISQTGADLVVMASHVPGFASILSPSHGGNIAAHATVSVFIVR